MNSVLSGLNGTRCFVYLDDIVIYAKSLADHNIKLREVLGRLRTYRLKLQPEKSNFSEKKLPRSPNNGGWGKARPPKGGCNYELSDTHLGEGAENILRNDKLLS